MARTMSWIGCFIGLISLAFAPTAQSARLHRDEQALIIIKTTKTMQQALSDIKSAITTNNYVFIRMQYIDSRLTQAKTENGKVVLVYFCNFNMLHHALKLESRVGVFLPCKVTLIQRSGYVELVAVNPKFISHRLKEKRLNEICQKLSHDYRAILEDASL